MFCSFRSDLRSTLVVVEESSFSTADDALLARPSLPPLTPGAYYHLQEWSGAQTKGPGLSVRVNLDDGDLLKCCLGRKPNAIGFDTTGDGLVDALDTAGDGFLDKTLTVVKPADKDVVAARDEDVGQKAREIFDMIDRDAAGSISKLDLVGAMQHQKTVNDFVLPDAHGATVFSDASGRTFEMVEDLFRRISDGKSRIEKDTFVDYYQRQTVTSKDEVQKLFEMIDLDHTGNLSKYEVLAGLQRIPELRKLVFPNSNGDFVLSEDLWKKVDDFFENISGGKARLSFEDFATFYHIQMSPSRGHAKLDRSKKSVLIIGPGFGREVNPAQSALVMRAGFRINWILDIPNPETPGFQMEQHLNKVVLAKQRFQPDLVVSASKGSSYVFALWNVGMSDFATLFINAHPALQKLPRNVNVVIAHGSNDEVWTRTRTHLENLMSTGDFNRCFLYWSANSGQIRGGFSRYGDKHNMASLLTYDLLPRLMDAALSTCPENQIVFSWRDRLAQARNDAETLLTGDPMQWAMSFWDSKGKEILNQVQPSSDEYNAVFRLFHTTPPEPANYQQSVSSSPWSLTRIIDIQRVQNESLMKGMQTYFKKLSMLFKQEGVDFSPNIHTRWVFHGTDAVDAIVTDPLTGFQPLVSGSRMGALWGRGTYFARDAKYVADSNFCSPVADGKKRMLLCLIVIGIPCLGDPNHTGILPCRNGQPPYKYNSTVDSLSSPEIFIIQEPSAGYPAYVITYE